MSSWNGFSNLNLSGVTPDDYAPLTVGEFTLRSTDAEIKTAPNGVNKRLVVAFTDVEGSGSIKHGFNLVNPSAQAQEIGKKQLKSFLVAGGHPNPDHPGDLETLKGLTVRVYVGMGKPYVGDDGQRRQNPEIKRFILDGEGAAPATPVGGAAAGGIADDQIPF